MDDQKIYNAYKNITDYLAGFSNCLTRPVSQNERKDLADAFKKANEDQKKALKKKQRALEDARVEFFNNFTMNCNKLKRLVEDKKLKAETVTAIYNEILHALKDLVGEAPLKDDKEKPLYNFYKNPAFLVMPRPAPKPAADSAMAEEDVVAVEEEKPTVTPKQIIEKIDQRIEMLRKNCHKYLDKEYSYPKLAQIGRVVGTIVAGLVAGVLGIGLMFTLANYSSLIFTDIIAKTITSQLGVFLLPGLALGGMGFAGGYYAFFKNGHRAKTNELADSIEQLMKAKVDYDSCVAYIESGEVESYFKKDAK